MPHRSVAKVRIMTIPCIVCGNGIVVGKNKKNSERCLDCGVAEAEATIRQIGEKSGPRYDAWREGMRRAFGN
jgi:hypothetical protein